MRFLRKNNDGGSDWHNGLSFFVKSIERPSVQPQVEEINQYNKKRVIHTGVKYNPISCSLYDTADGAAMMMWAQYATYYFGDYNQNPNSYKDDIINESMLGSDKGYGYTITPTTPAEPEGINSQFFFDRVEVYQVWGGEYTTYQLLNPKITNFTPDELDYDQNAASMINVTLQFEAVYHDNGGKPQSIGENDFLVGIFGSEFSGETFDPDAADARKTSFTSTTNLENQLDNPTTRNFQSKADYSRLLPVETGEATTSAGGALSKFGSFDFGNFKSLSGGLPTEVSSLIGMRDATQAALGSNLASIPDVAAGVQFAAFATKTSPLDQASNNNTILDKFGSSPFYAFEVSGDGDLPAPAAVNANVTAPSKVDNEGLSLSPLTIAAVNSRSNGRSQIGYRSGGTTRPTSYLREPTPAPKLTPDLVFGRVRIGFNFSRTILGNTTPPPIVSTLNVAIDILTLIEGETNSSGTIDRNLIIAASLVGSVTPSVSVASSVVIGATARGNTTNRGSINKPIIVSSNIRGQAKVSATIARSITISSNIRANVTLRSGILNKSIVVAPSISGIVLVEGTLNKSITVDSGALGFLTVDSTLDKSIIISAQALGSYYDGQTGTLNKQLTITSNIRGRSVAAGINRPVIITMTAFGGMTPAAFVDEPVIVSSNIVGYQVAGDIAGTVVVGTESEVWHLFGNGNGDVVVASTAIAYLDPTGFILDPNFGMTTIIDGIQLFGTQDSPIIIPINMSGFILTQQHYLTGDMKNTAQDTLELSGDASDGDDWLNHSGDN